MKTNFKLKLWPTLWMGGSRHWPINRIFLEAEGPQGESMGGPLAYIEHHGSGHGKPLHEGGNEVYPTQEDAIFARELVKRWNDRQKLTAYLKEHIATCEEHAKVARQMGNDTRSAENQAKVRAFHEVATVMGIGD